MQIIDIHAHIYQRVAGITQGQPMASTSLGRVTIGNREVQFLPPSFDQTSSKAETLIAYMDWCGVDKALLMPNPYYGYHNAYFEESAKQYPGRLKGIALVDFLKGKTAADELSGIYGKGVLSGFKIETYSTFQCAPHKRMADQEFSAIWDCCNQYRQPVFLHMFRDCDVEDFASLLDNYPHITFVVCHMGADACFRPWVKKENFNHVLELVRTHPNAYIDTSTVPTYFTEEYPFPSSVAIIEKAYEALGPEKIMWASDYPGMLNHATFQELINLVATGCKKIPEHHKELIMGKNAQWLFF